jgi:hypothetical protein
MTRHRQGVLWLAANLPHDWTGRFGNRNRNRRRWRWGRMRCCWGGRCCGASRWAGSGAWSRCCGRCSPSWSWPWRVPIESPSSRSPVPAAWGSCLLYQEPQMIRADCCGQMAYSLTASVCLHPHCDFVSFSLPPSWRCCMTHAAADSAGADGVPQPQAHHTQPCVGTRCRIVVRPAWKIHAVGIRRDTACGRVYCRHGEAWGQQATRMRAAESCSRLRLRS